MAGLIEDYALLGDTETVALVGRDGAIDWLCLPRIDSPACFAALLGDEDDGQWLLGPAAGGPATRRRYRGPTLVLESEWDTDGGTVRVLDMLPPRDQALNVVRIVEGVSGTVEMRSELRLRFDYGRRIPWVRRLADHQLAAIAGPDSVTLWCEAPTRGEDWSTVSEFSIDAGERVSFVLTWRPSHEPPPRPIEPDDALQRSINFWEDWAERADLSGRWRDVLLRSVLTLKALTYEPTGGLVAAATTSLPEAIGGVRNWDYRYCWLRDAAMTLESMIRCGYTDEADQWATWLRRAVAGRAEDVQVMYGVAGETSLPERELDWLAGYEQSAPVRVGNAAAEQLQLDVFGAVLDALDLARRNGVDEDDDSWELQVRLVEHLETIWDEPDHGLWEVRTEPRHFVHSKVMAWVAFDRMAEAAKAKKMDEQAMRWRSLADDVHEQVCSKGFDPDRNTFVLAYDSDALDASLLLLPRIGFLPPDDPRMVGTIDAVQRELTVDGLVLRYRMDDAGMEDGLPGAEGAFIACSFWLVEALSRIGRTDEAVELFERLLGLANDVGLLAEEYDVEAGRQLGNFPQAYSHLALVNAALAIDQS
ncbi:MAG: glycoside hydrolase family 15 protein [Actinomycetota bacterium]|nr:glycoside hydrolase family 15 protein [Actinomycetota bacterium]